MPRGVRNYSREELGMTQVDEKPTYNPVIGTSDNLKIKESKLAQQKVHHVVRTINKNNSFGEDGSVPMMEAENQLNQDWLAKGWTIVASFLVGRNEGQFEICWVLTQ
jgi:hypothetical protein